MSVGKDSLTRRSVARSGWRLGIVFTRALAQAGLTHHVQYMLSSQCAAALFTHVSILTDFPELPLLTKLTEIMPPDGFRKVQKYTISCSAVHIHIFESKK